MYNDRDLMEQLDRLPSADLPLTAGELDRLSRTVLDRVARAQGSAPRPRRRWPVWARALTGAAACLCLLAGLNSVNPALAEGLPLVGDVFAYINGLDKAPLRSDQLSGYAQPAQVQASPAPDTPQEDAASQEAGAEKMLHPEACTLTLRQIYCDELYLRVGLVLTAEDDSLAGFDRVTIDPPLLDDVEQETEANALYGGVTLNGQAVPCDVLPRFVKQDDHTFVCEMDYNLANYTGDTQDMQAEITLSNLVGVVESGEGEPQRTPLPGSYPLSFTVSADETLTRLGTFENGTQNGITLQSVAVTPGETCVTCAFGPSLPEGESPALQVFAGGSQLQAANGTYSEADGAVALREYFDAVPEGVTTLTVRAVDKNSQDLRTLAEWTVTLPQ